MASVTNSLKVFFLGISDGEGAVATQESFSRIPNFATLPIYFPLCLLALTDIWDNLSRIFRDKGD